MKRWLWIIVLLGALTGLFIGINRFTIESGPEAVELVYDLDALSRLALENGFDLFDLLRQLKLNGVQSIGVTPRSLGDMLINREPLPDHVLLYVQEHIDDLNKLLGYPVYFAASDFELVTQAGLSVVPRLSNPPWSWESFAWIETNPELVILGGKESPGYPNDLEAVRHEIDQLHARLGVVEFAVQAGVEELADPDQMVRVHGITIQEMNLLSEDRIINRYVRAVRERNIRVLYLRPFLHGENSWARSIQLLQSLSSGLEQAGFTIGEAEPFPHWEVPFPLTLLVWAGIWAATVLYGMKWLAWQPWVFAGGGLVGLVITIGLGSRNLVLAQQGMALLAAVVFPSLAVETVKGRSTAAQYVWISSVSLLGALVVVGTLTGTSYLIKLTEFRGIKVMHLLPILLVLAAGVFHTVRPIRTLSQGVEVLKNWWNHKLPIKHLFLVLIGGLLGFIYLKRTGNFGLPVPQIEVFLREILEYILFARPRTKEFLVGHPALYFALRSRQGNFSWWLPVAVVGQLSMINTFTHIHTPLLLSLIRTVYGLVFGYFIGWLFYRLYLLGKGLFQRDPNIGLLRIRQSR